jgi:uncharacterized protein YbbK (DUF523 family)
MIRILVSSCLLGQRIRYNGMDAPSDKTILAQWREEGRLVNFCPELAAGFPVPRPPAETVGGDGRMVLLGQARVFEDTGADVTDVFVEGAEKAVNYAKKHEVRIAILTDGSPSCGSTYVYDGTFGGGQVPGKGVTAAHMEENGIALFSEDQIEAASDYLASLLAAGEENE